MKLTRTARVSLLLTALSAWLCASAPPERGGELRAGAGYGNYSYTSGGCGGPVYRNEANDLRAHARASYYADSGARVVVEGSANRSRVHATEKIEEGEPDVEPAVEDFHLGRVSFGWNAAARVGWHGNYFGAEAGVAVFSTSVTAPNNNEHEIALLPSATLWAGHPEYVYAWASFMEGPISPSFIPIAAGLGHTQKNFRARLGYNIQDQVSLQADLALPLERPMWLGVLAHGKGADDWGAWLMLSVPLGVLE
jgi:hypothetical protein